MNILSNFKTWSTRAKNATTAFLFLGAYTISMVAPFVPTQTASAYQSSSHEVVCHRLGNGGSNAIPPDQQSAHIPNHVDTSNLSHSDYIIYATYPDNANWNDLKATLDAKCTTDDPAPPKNVTAPTYTDACGTVNDTYTIPTDPYATYKVNGTTKNAGTYAGSGTVNIVAVPKTYSFTYYGHTYTWNYQLNPPTTWTFSFTNVSCNGSITVTKVVNNTHGGSAKAGDFKLYVNSTQVVSGSATNFAANQTYTVSESGGPSGYTQTSLSCKNYAGQELGATFTLGAAQNISCTITNDDQPGTLIVNKVLVNDNGGSKTVQSFSYTVNNGAAVSFEADGSNSQTVNAGKYTVAEITDPGYVTTYANSLNGYANCSDLVVPNGGTVTCTITNDDKTAQLTLVKNIVNDNGGIAKATDWTLNASGKTPISGVTGSAAVTAANVSAGTYNLSETGGPSGYTASNWVCTGGTQDGASVTLSSGQTASCAITNDDNAPYLQLVKTVTNDNGGTAANTAWTLIATGSSPATSFQGTSGVNSTGVTSFQAGSYTLSESNGPSGYTAGNWSCTGGTAIGGVIQLVLGQSAICTINNNDNAPKLTLNKIVVNDNGGTAHESDWTLTANGGIAGTLTGHGAVGNTDVVSGSSFKAGKYTLSESGGPSGYAASAWSCTGGKTPNAYNEITMNLGDDVTCTITNNDKAPQLTLIKKVINDNGGTKKANDWKLSANGPSSFSGYGQVSSGSNLKIGTYTLSESGPGGYAASNWDCGYTAVNWSKVTLKLGDTVACTITNNDKPSTITVIKNVDDGFGHVTKDVKSWTWNYSGPTWKNGIATGSTNAQQVNAGSYTVTENQKPGYHVVASSCKEDSYNPYGNDDKWGYDGQHEYNLPNTSQKVTLGLDDHVTCTFTNKRDTGTVTVHKKIGNKWDPRGWTWWLGDSEENNHMGDTKKVASGWYWFGENQQSGYSFDSLKCKIDGRSVWVNQNVTAKIYVGKDDHVECTFTNSRDTGNVTIVKDARPDSSQGFVFTIEPVSTNVDEGGDSYNSDVVQSESIVGDQDNQPSWYKEGNYSGETNPTTTFTLTDDGTGKNSQSTLLPTGKYRVSEATVKGWDLSSISCGETKVDIEDGVLYLNVVKGVNIVCTFVNTKRAQLTIVKDVQPGTSTKAFSFTTNAATDELGADTTFSLTDDGTGLSSSKQFENLQPGTYTVTEQADSAWKLNDIVCTGTGVTMIRDGAKLKVTLAAGAVASCTFTNSFIPQVLAETTTLANTGTSGLATTIIALTLIGAAVGLTFASRKQMATETIK